jgi:hypothetical protein
MTRSSVLYFPNPDSDALRPFGQAFVRMMFAHARLEREIRDLQDAITGKSGFGEQAPLCSARGRPEVIKKLIAKHAPRMRGTVAIYRLLRKAIKPCDDRNLLAHGDWWCFDQAGTITVRGGKSFVKGKPPKRRDFTLGKIDRIASDLRDIEDGLYRLRWQIEQRRRKAP